MRDEIVNEIVSGLKLPAAVAKKLLNQYLETLPKDVGQLEEYIAQGDFASASKVAHSIKGASGNLRIAKISRIAGELEHILKDASEGSGESADALFRELNDLVKKLV